MKPAIKNPDSIKQRRGYQLKYNLIPKEERELKVLYDKEKEKKFRVIRYKEELQLIVLGLNKQIDKNSYLDGLKCPVGKPKGIKIPKSIGGTGK